MEKRSKMRMSLFVKTSQGYCTRGIDHNCWKVLRRGCNCSKAREVGNNYCIEKYTVHRIAVDQRGHLTVQHGSLFLCSLLARIVEEQSVRRFC